MQSYGVNDFATCCAAAALRGVTPEHVIALVEHARSKACGDVPAWDPGSLWSRVRNASARIPIAEAWHPHPERWIRAVRDRELAAARPRDQTMTTHTPIEDLERDYGEVLDALSEQALQQLAEQRGLSWEFVGRMFRNKERYRRSLLLLVAGRQPQHERTEA